MMQPGWQCPQCTVVNAAGAPNCNMCSGPNPMMNAGAPPAYDASAPPMYNDQQQQPMMYGQQQHQPMMAYGQPQPQMGAPVAYQPQYVQPQPISGQPQPMQASVVPVSAAPQSANVVMSDDMNSKPQRMGDKMGIGAEIDYEHDKRYRDKFWAIFFIIHFIVMLVVFFMNLGNLQKTFDDAAQAADDNPPPEEEITVSLGSTSNIIICVVAMAALSVGFGALWLGIMKRYAAVIIKFMLIVMIIVHLIGFLTALMYGQTWGAIISLLFLVLFLVYAWFVRRRIPFATALLKMASQVVQDCGGPVYVAYGMALAEIAWIVFWVLLLLAINEQINGSGIIVFLLFVSFYWTSEVMSNIVHVTAAGVVGTWYYNPQPKQPTKGAFKRATTTSFGSICFGSFLIAVVKAIRAMIEIARDQSRDNAIVLCILDCIMGCVQRMLEYFNVYAFANVAIYGHDFITAAKETIQLFKTSLFDAIINDDLTGFVLFLGAFMGGVAAAVAGAFLALALSVNPIFVAIISFFVGLFVVSLVMNVVRSNVATFFVLFADDPAALAQTHPEHYNEIRAAIEVMHGGDYDNHFG